MWAWDPTTFPNALTGAIEPLQLKNSLIISSALQILSSGIFITYASAGIRLPHRSPTISLFSSPVLLQAKTMPLLSKALFHNPPASLRVHVDNVSRVIELPKLPMLDIYEIFRAKGFCNRK